MLDKEIVRIVTYNTTYTESHYILNLQERNTAYQKYLE